MRSIKMNDTIVEYDQVEQEPKFNKPRGGKPMITKKQLIEEYQTEKEHEAQLSTENKLTEFKRLRERAVQFWIETFEYEPSLSDLRIDFDGENLRISWDGITLQYGYECGPYFQVVNQCPTCEVHIFSYFCYSRSAVARQLVEFTSPHRCKTKTPQETPGFPVRIFDGKDILDVQRKINKSLYQSGLNVRLMTQTETVINDGTPRITITLYLDEKTV